MTDEEFPPICPRCRSNRITYEKQHEYTGGGFSDYWYEFYCENCGNEWKGEKTHGYY